MQFIAGGCDHASENTVIASVTSSENTVVAIVWFLTFTSLFLQRKTDRLGLYGMLIYVLNSQTQKYWSHNKVYNSLGSTTKPEGKYSQMGDRRWAQNVFQEAATGAREARHFFVAITKAIPRLQFLW